MNLVHAFNKEKLCMCSVKQIIGELFYPKEAENWQTYAACLELGTKIAERVLIEFQDVSKVTSKFINGLDGESIACPKQSIKRRNNDMALV